MSVMNAQSAYGPPTSPAATLSTSRFPPANSPGALDMYNGTSESVTGYVQAASPQPTGFPSIAVSIPSCNANHALLPSLEWCEC